MRVRYPYTDTFRGSPSFIHLASPRLTSPKFTFPSIKQTTNHHLLRLKKFTPLFIPLSPSLSKTRSAKRNAPYRVRTDDFLCEPKPTLPRRQRSQGEQLRRRFSRVCGTGALPLGQRRFDCWGFRTYLPL